MGRTIYLIVWIWLIITLVSCGATPPNRYYTLVNDTKLPGTKTTIRACSLPLVIASVMAASPYKDDKIVFRTNDYEIRYYNYRFWVDPPEQMIMGLLQLKMADSDLFRAVEYRINSSSEHLALYVKLNAIEERDRDEQWYARLAMSLVLKTSDNEAVVWRYVFDEERAVIKRDTIGIVATISDVYNEGIDSAIESLSDFVRSYPDCLEPSSEGIRSVSQ